MFLKVIWNNLEIRNKLFLLTATLMIIFSILLMAFMYWLMPKLYYDYKVEQIYQEVEALVEDLKESENLYELVLNFGPKNGSLVTIKDTNNEMIYPFMQFNQDRMLKRVNDQNELIHFEKSFYYAPLNQVLVLDVLMDFQPIYEAKIVVALFIPFMIIFIMGLTLGLAVIYAALISKPILKINQATKQMCKFDFSSLLEIRGHDEIGQLSRSINEMSQTLKESLEELQSSNEKLKSDIEREREIEKQRRDFIATISHELKSPLTIILGQIQGMQLGIGKYKNHDVYLQQSYEVALSMQQLVNELMSLNKLENNMLNLNLESFNLSELITGIIKSKDYLVVSNRLKLSVNLIEERWIIGDQSLLKHAITNIIVNALTYTPSDERVEVVLSQDEFIVYNEGVSISEREMNHLFQPFYRIEKSRSRETGGSGLGLYIVKIILDRHQNISYELSSDCNSVTFKLRLN